MRHVSAVPVARSDTVGLTGRHCDDARDALAGTVIEAAPERGLV